MTVAAARKRPAIIIAGLLLGLLAVILQGVQGEELEKLVPSEDQCRPYIEKALKDFGAEGSEEQTLIDPDGNEAEDDEASTASSREAAHTDSGENAITLDAESSSGGSREKRDASVEETSGEIPVDEQQQQQQQVDTVEVTSVEADDEEEQLKNLVQATDEAASSAAVDETSSQENGGQSIGGDPEEDEKTDAENDDNEDTSVIDDESSEQKASDEQQQQSQEEHDLLLLLDDEAQELSVKSTEEGEDETGSKLEENAIAKEASMTASSAAKIVSALDDDGDDDKDDGNKKDGKKQTSIEEEIVVLSEEISIITVQESNKVAAADIEADENEEKAADDEEISNEQQLQATESVEVATAAETATVTDDQNEERSSSSSPEEEELIMEIEIPEVLRPRDHIGQLLKLDEENEGKEKAVGKVAEIVLRDLKKLYDNAIKPLETLYKYRDLSNRHFGDPEIFSKPLVLFMGPWSGGKSSIINYLLDIEYKSTSLRTGAEPSPAYFNILMHGDEEEVLDGTQLAADWTFSGLQKFGQGLLDRLKGYKLNSKLLEKVNIVEIPGILEIRKQVQRLFPFNDACQWFIDRADIIFLVYDPAKLDVGPETEAILDQLKGREYQTRIILNKADQVKPEELMRVQGALIWNISPLMSSAEPPIMYSTSLWSLPYESGAPTRLLYAQERAFLRDLRSAIDKRVEHKIASARRFAVRVRNHAKMVDCYLTTYYNHKSFFAKKKDVAERIVESPQDYHIYEGLSTLTNISRYDLPDPDVYRDFFRLNNLYEFPLLSSTCTYFRGCPINRLDVAIAYDLPELVGKYKKSADAASQLHGATAAPEELVATSAPAQQDVAAASKTQKAKSGASTISLS